MKRIFMQGFQIQFNNLVPYVILIYISAKFDPTKKHKSQKSIKEIFIVFAISALTSICIKKASISTIY